MIALVLLAAGRSRRMGAQKLLLPLGDRPVIEHVVSAALESRLRPVVVVVGHEAERVRAALPAGDLMVVENHAFVSGLSTSLRAGIQALPPNARGAVIALADQPLVTAAHLDRLADMAEATGAQILAASYGGERGNPVYFARAYFAELEAATGDEGGRSVIARHQDALALCELDDQDARLDVDTPSDYARVLALWQHRRPVP